MGHLGTHIGMVMIRVTVEPAKSPAEVYGSPHVSLSFLCNVLEHIYISFLQAISLPCYAAWSSGDERSELSCGKQCHNITSNPETKASAAWHRARVPFAMGYLLLR